MTVAALFVRRDSIYKTFPGVDCFDIERDARTWAGGAGVVAHPPCRAFGRLRTFAKPRVDEKHLAYFAVAAVRKFGGVLEHPASSTLWAEQMLPRPGGSSQQFDAFGGWTLCVDQSWFGHTSQKRTWVYIVGLQPGDTPRIPLRLGRVHGKVETMSKAAREETPPAFAAWLVEVATLAQLSKRGACW